jgi:ParB family chromosome partitioning protein
MAKHGLGRGLGALLPSRGEEGLQEIPVEAILPNPKQPRKSFDSNTLQQLSESMKQSGILQPVLVRRQGAQYQLIVGERRWRAARLAGIEKIPAVIREATDAESIELALVENLLREDLNPLEEAEAYQRLLAEFSWTQENLARRVGRDRSSVSNSLRLLRLPAVIQDDLRSGRLTMGHARALLSLTTSAEQLKLREEILAHSWSVRRTEEGVKRRRVPRRAARRALELDILEEALRESLVTRVRIVGSEKRGRIEVAYSSREELERLIDQIAGRKR